jgi:hypothetical protein
MKIQAINYLIKKIKKSKQLINGDYPKSREKHD